MVKDLNFPAQIFNVLMGKAGKFTGKISIDGESIISGKRQNFVYLPFPDVLPGKLSVNSIINLIAGLYKTPKPDKEKIKGEFKEMLKVPFENIKGIDKVNLMLKMAEYKKAEIYLFNNFLLNIESEKLPVIIDKIKKDNILIIEVDSTHVDLCKFDRFCVIRYDKESKYEELKAVGK